MKNALELIKEFCNYCYVERNLEKTLSILSKEVSWYGTIDHRDIHSIQEARTYIDKQIQETTDTYDIEYEEEQVIALGEEASLANLKIKIVSIGVGELVHVSASAAMEDGESKIITMHVSALEAIEKRQESEAVTEGKKTVRMLWQKAQNDGSAGGVAIYHVLQGNGVADYISPAVAAIHGMTVEEYLQQYGEDTNASIYKEDRAMVVKSIQTALSNNVPTALIFRVFCKDGGYIWVNGTFSRYISSDSTSYVRAVLYPASQQMEAQMEILDQTVNGIYIINEDNYELYYCNRPGFKMHNVRYHNYAGSLCYEVLHQRHLPCDFCKFNEALNTKGSVETYDPSTHHVYEVRAREVEWNKNTAVIVYETDITETKLAEEQIRRGEEITEAASRFAKMWIWTYEIETGRIRCYNLLREEYGLPEILEDFPNSWFKMGFVPKEYVEIYRRSVERIAEGEKQVSFQCKGYFADGSLHWMRCNFNRLPNQPGQPTVVVCTAQPIDWEKALEMRITLEQQKPFVNQKLLLGYTITNLSKNKMLTHRSIYNSVNYGIQDMTLQEAVIVAIKDIPDQKQKDVFIKTHDLNHLLEFYEQGGTSDLIEYRRDISDGRCLWVRNILDVLRDPSTGDILLYEYYYDNDTEKKQKMAIDSLVDEEIDYLATVNIKTTRGRLIRAGEKFMSDEYWKNFEYDSVMKQMIDKRVIDSDKERCLQFFTLPFLIEGLEKDKNISITYCILEEGRIKRKNVQVFYLDETHEDIVIARNDVTDIYEEEQKQKNVLQQALDAANQASRAKGDFLSQMSHEIRTPMNAIMGMTKLAKEEATSLQTIEYLEKIESASDYLLGIINDVLDMSRIESGKLILKREWVRVSELMINCVNMVIPMAEEKGIQFTYPKTTRIDAYEYYVDPLRTKQILMNLLNNAVKFTPKGGSITLSARTLNVTDSECTEELSFCDTGCGMSDEFLQRIFHPFEQEHNSFSGMVQGTGLGLAIVKNIVKAAGGDIRVESKLGTGSAFIVTLPHKYRLAPTKSKVEKEKDSENGLEGRRILLVDDHPLNREIAKKLLEKKGALIETATNGKEAVDVFCASNQNHYEAVLMDIRMPVMNGLEASKEIRGMNRVDATQIPIIAMTANAFDEDVQNTLAAGMNAHLTKPINPKLLYQVLGEQIKVYDENRRQTKENGN